MPRGPRRAIAVHLTGKARILRLNNDNDGTGMRVIIHAGAHNTDDDRLIACLLENREMLSQRGIHVPDPNQYRRAIREILQHSGDRGLVRGAREILAAALGDLGAVDRLVLSNAGFFGTPKMAVGGGLFYRAAEHRLDLFRQMFPGDRIELFLGLRDPAGFLPALLNKTAFNGMEDLLRGCEPGDMRWSELVLRLRNSHPDIALTLWCNEDTPLIWSQVLRAVAGIDQSLPLAGEFTLLSELMSATGMARFEAYLESHPDMTEAQKGRIIEAFLAKFANEEALEEEFDLAGWTEEIIASLTAIYERDVHDISRMEGLRFILP